jgi:hypothetical protein
MLAASIHKPLQAATTPIELGLIPFVANISCLYHVYVRGEAYLAAGQGSAAAAEFQKILDHSGIVWNCWTGALAHLGVARANALEAKTSQGADADAARVRSPPTKISLRCGRTPTQIFPFSSLPNRNTPSCSNFQGFHYRFR